MWSPHADYGASWPEDMGTPMTAMGHHSAVFGQMPMPSMGGPLEATTALTLCEPLSLHMQATASRVQKLERSRGQINKDITDMIKEAQDWRKAAAEAAKSPNGAGAKKTAAGIPELPVKRGVTAPPTGAGNFTPIAAKSTSLTPPPGLQAATFSLPELPQLVVTEEQVEGRSVHVIKWRIDRVETKFRDCIGRPLVSQPFEVKDKMNLPELRLMVSPNIGENVNSMTMKEQKSRYEAVISDGPLTGALKLKVVNNFGDRLMITFNLFVGSQKKGPLTHDFADSIIHVCDFDSDWLKEFENGSLLVGVEILGLNEDASPS